MLPLTPVQREHRGHAEAGRPRGRALPIRGLRVRPFIARKVALDLRVMFGIRSKSGPSH